MNSIIRQVLPGLVAVAALAACVEEPSRPDRHRHWPREQVTCSSDGWAKQRCAPDWRDARLLETLSRKSCRRGESWDVDGHGLWVDGGCRGRFERAGDGRYDDDRDDGDIVACASMNNDYRRCELEHRISHAAVHRRLSVADCERGESWGWEGRAIWVDKGCRAEFEVEWR